MGLGFGKASTPFLGLLSLRLEWNAAENATTPLAPRGQEGPASQALQAPLAWTPPHLTPFFTPTPAPCVNITCPAGLVGFGGEG